MYPQDTPEEDNSMEQDTASPEQSSVSPHNLAEMKLSELRLRFWQEQIRTYVLSLFLEGVSRSLFRCENEEQVETTMQTLRASLRNGADRGGDPILPLWDLVAKHAEIKGLKPKKAEELYSMYLRRDDLDGAFDSDITYLQARIHQHEKLLEVAAAQTPYQKLYGDAGRLAEKIQGSGVEEVTKLHYATLHDLLRTVRHTQSRFLMDIQKLLIYPEQGRDHKIETFEDIEKARQVLVHIEYNDEDNNSRIVSLPLLTGCIYNEVCSASMKNCPSMQELLGAYSPLLAETWLREARNIVQVERAMRTATIYLDEAKAKDYPVVKGEPAIAVN